MPRKAFLVQVELNVQTITCPGVWLCPNGKISLQIHMLGSSIQSQCVAPVFPVVIDEKFIFRRSYFDVGKLGTLQKIFNKDTLYIELIQWQNCENGNVLATFQTSLAELLYPESRKQSLGNAEVDLLMEPMRHFPGILAPKIEVGTKTIIQDEICPCKDDLEPQVVCNPNLILSNKALKNGSEHQILRQKPVCHTKQCHIAKCGAVKSESHIETTETRPPFVVRKVPDDLKYYCNCKDCKCARGDDRDDHRQDTQLAMAKKEPKLRIIHTKTSTVRKVPKEPGPGKCCKVPKECNQYRHSFQLKPGPTCDCGDEHSDNCAVCAKYKHYFESRSIRSQKRQERKNDIYDCHCQQATNRSDIDDAILSNYPPTAQAQYKQPTMAQKLHARLSETLTRCDCQPTIDNNCACGDCICDNLRDCGTGSLSQFYKKFYTCSNKCP